MTLLKYAALALALMVAALAVAAWVYRDIPAAILEARYTTPASKFLNVDGVRIHYRDEGHGPPLVLIHANFASLLSWDTWIPLLAPHHRVLRFDMTGHGLTGPDPGGDYSLDRTVHLTERFVDALGLERFALGGTSLGGTVALRYASLHPDRVDRLILLSPGALEGRAMRDEGTRLPAAARILEWITPRALARYMLRSRFGDPQRVTPELVDRWHDMWMREGQRRAILDRLGSYTSLDVAAVAGTIRVPTLVLWGEANPQTPIDQAHELYGLLTHAPARQLITYPGIGHMAAEEGGEVIARDVAAFLAEAVPGASGAAP